MNTPIHAADAQRFELQGDDLHIDGGRNVAALARDASTAMHAIGASWLSMHRAAEHAGL